MCLEVYQNPSQKTQSDTQASGNINNMPLIDQQRSDFKRQQTFAAVQFYSSCLQAQLYYLSPTLAAQCHKCTQNEHKYPFHIKSFSFSLTNKSLCMK